MFATILNILTGGVLSKVLDFFQTKENNRIAALNTERRLAHDQNMAERQSRKEIRLATASYWEMRLGTGLIAFPFIFHLWSVWLDTQFKFGWQIDKFPAPMDEWEGAILLSFFGITMIGGGIKAIAGAIAYRGRK